MYWSEDYGTIPHPPEYWAVSCPDCEGEYIPADRNYGYEHDCPAVAVTEPDWDLIPADHMQQDTIEETS